MNRVLKAEIFKLGRRREFILILCSAVLSFGLPLAFTLAPQSYKMDYAFGDKIPLVAYSVLGYAFWGVLGVFTLLYTILTVGLSSAEIETHYFYLYFPRIFNRKIIYKSKTLALIGFTIIWYIVYTLVLNPISYRLLYYSRPDMTSGALSDGSHIYWCCMWLLYLLELIFYISLTLALGSKYKPLTTIAIILAIFYGSLFFYDIPIIRYVLPEFYKQRAIASDDISNYSSLFRYILLYIGITTILDILLYFYGRKKILKLDA
jgi:hypothetical protein